MKRTVQTSLTNKIHIHKDLVHRMRSCKVRQKAARDKVRGIVDKQRV